MVAIPLISPKNNGKVAQNMHHKCKQNMGVVNANTVDVNEPKNNLNYTREVTLHSALVMSP